MDDTLLLIGTYYLVAVFCIIIVLNVIDYYNKKKYKKQIDNLDIEKNSMLDSSILTELSKVEGLNRTEDLNNRYELWKSEIDELKVDLNNQINEMILDADFLVEQKKYKEYEAKRPLIDIKLYEVNALKDRIKSEIEEITKSEEKNRGLVTDLKTRFRNAVSVYKNSKDSFRPADNAIDLQIDTIVKRIDDFEYDMDNQDYISANKLITLIDTLITHFETIVDEVPASLLMSNNLIPKRLLDIKSMYDNMVKSGYQLDYLNVEYNIDEINKKLVDINTRINMLNQEDILFELKTIMEYTDTLFKNFEIEKIARKEFEDAVMLYKTKSTKINNIMDKLYGKVVDSKYNYQLPEKNLEELNNLNASLKLLDSDFNKLYDVTNTYSFPYTRLNKELGTLIGSISRIEDEVGKFIESVGNMKEDEKRAREQLDDMNILIEASKNRIREYKLPIVPESFYTELTEGIEAVREVTKELNRKPINIEVLNTRVDTARDLSFKVNNTANELVKTASLAEFAFVYANRYRFKKEYIEEGLNKSEVLFLKGEYKKSLDLTLNTLDVVEPGIYKKILNMYEKNSN